MSLKLKKKKKTPKQQPLFKSIDTLHQEKMDFFKSLQDSLPKKLKTLETLKKKNQDTNELQKQIEKIRSRELETEYYLQTSNILKKYFELPQSDNIELDIENLKHDKNDTRKELTLQYYNAIELHYPHEIRLGKYKASYCKTCDKEMKENDEKFLVCEYCGITDNAGHLVDAMSYKDIQESNPVINFNYKRINYFTEWLNNLQAKENITIEDDTIEIIKIELSKRRIRDNRALNHATMKKILKELHLNKYYEHIPLITYMICGSKPINIPTAVVEKMRGMFMLIQYPFELLKGEGRSNFFSYPYIFYKFCELLDLDEYLKEFSLLKTREKLINQDILWKKIVSYLHESTGNPIWKFIPSC